MEYGVYFGLSAGREITGRINDIASQLPAKSINRSHSWALKGKGGKIEKPPHISLMRRTQLDIEVNYDILQGLGVEIGYLLAKSRGLKLKPNINPLTFDLVAEPYPNSHEVEIFAKITSLLINKLGINCNAIQSHHMRIASLKQRRVAGKIAEINFGLLDYPIYFHPTLVYASHTDPTSKLTIGVSISKLH